MSRGLGRLERYILECVSETEKRGKKCTKRTVRATGYRLASCYFEPADFDGFQYEPTPAQRKAMTRALHSFVRKFPQYALMGGKGRKTLLLYEPGDPVSAAWAKLMLTASFVSTDEARRAAITTDNVSQIGKRA